MIFSKIKTALIVILLSGLIWIFAERAVIMSESVVVEIDLADLKGDTLVQFLDEKGEPMTIVGEGKQRRDFTYVDDVVEANMLAGEADFNGFFAFNIGHGENRSVNEIAALFGGPTVKLPKRIEPKVTLADNTRARSALGWAPTMTVEEWVPKWKKELGID